MTNSENNPLINPPKLKYDAIPFDLIKMEHFEPAVNFALAEAKRKLTDIEENPDGPTFENTILAMECAGDLLGRVTRVYGLLHAHESDNKFKDLALKLNPLLSEYSHHIITNKTLFKRVKNVYENQDTTNLTHEQVRLVKDRYDSYIKNGIHLDDNQQDKLKSIKMELSQLGSKFAQNMLNSTNSFEYTITDESELEGIPGSAKALMAQTAKDNGKEGLWTILLQMPFTMPVFKYAKNRKLREKIVRASLSIAFNDEFDNQDIILKKVNLSSQLAKILGHDTYADYVLQDRMADSVEVVRDFLDSFFAISKSMAEKELVEVKKIAYDLDQIENIQPWDIGYYTEKLKQKKLKFNSEALRSYFKMENVIKGLFEIANKLYKLKFEEITDLPVFHPTVKTYEVSDNDHGHLGIFMLDLHPRQTKKDGAWESAIRSQGLTGGSVRRPIVCIGANLMPSTDERPSLLSMEEVKTIFHEFGHALHDLLSQCTYVSLSGTSVLHDFVELPSQIMENWVYEKDALDLFAIHHESGEKIPNELIEKVKKSQTFMAGRASLGQLGQEYLDFAWYAENPERISSVEDYEDEIDSKTRLLPKVEGTNSSCSFSHIFASGYAAGYYSYRWAETLDADAFELFQEEGIFNENVAKSFRENILEKGDTAHPMDLYVKFRGRKPDPNALMRRRGLIK